MKTADETVLGMQPADEAVDPLPQLLADPSMTAETRAVLEAVAIGKPVDSEIAGRLRERADAIRKRVQDEFGLLDIGVPAIRELRGPLPER